MKIDILGSGSSGNCIVVRSGNTCILVDAGIARTKIEKRLLEVGVRADEIQAILITHAHGDHIKGLPIANKYRIPVFASNGEWKDIKDVDDDLQYIIKAGAHWAVNQGEDWLDITPFSMHHDAYDPLGYAILAWDDEKASICLDTGSIDRDMISFMQDSDIYVIESNHDPAMVELCNRPDSVKARILSDIGHLSNEQTAAALTRLVQGKGERIYLTHLSGDNNMPVLAEMTVKRALAAKGFEAGTHFFLEVV